MALPLKPMFRLAWGKEEEATEDQTYPNPVLTRPDKYWLLGGVSIARSNPNDEIDAESVNLMQCVESARMWEHLKIPIFCTICLQLNNERPFIEQFHWKYLNCPSCVKFFVCWNCVESASKDTVKQLGVHREHGELVVIQTRPFTRPLYDGSDERHFEVFKSAKSADEFFLYFPWFFHGFSGMDEIRDHFRQVFIDRATAELGNPGADREALEEAIGFYNFPVDWFMRAYGSGNWRRLHQSLQGMVDERIQVAKSSARLHKLYLRLEGFADKKREVYGDADISHHPAAGNTRGLAESFGTFRDFLIYLMPLHILTVQNSSIDNAKLQTILRADKYQSRDSDDRPSSETSTAVHRPLVSANNSGYRMPGSNSHLANPIGPEVLRLWSMFKLLFEDVPEFDRLVQGIPSDMTPFVQYAVRTHHGTSFRCNVSLK
jgi:hypothetical protein